MKRSPCLLALIFFAFQTVSVGAQTSELEPNDIAGQASALLLNNTGYGSIEKPNDIDWWKVTTNSDGKLDITIQNTGNVGAIHVELYDSSFYTILDSVTVNENTVQTMHADGLGAGTYFIKMKGAAAIDTASYIISNTLIAVTGPNDKEPNDMWWFGPHTPIQLSDTVYGHIGYNHNGKIDKDDYFSFTTPADGNLYLTFNNGSNINSMEFNLGDSLNNGLLASFNDPGQSKTMEQQGLRAVPTLFG